MCAPVTKHHTTLLGSKKKKRKKVINEVLVGTVGE